MSTSDETISMPNRQPHKLVVLAALTVAACRPATETAPDLPPTDTGWPRDTGPWDELPPDSGEPDLDITPESWLYAYQSGSWSMSPTGGPFDTVVGSLEVLELVDVERPDPEDTGDPRPWEDDTGGASPVRCEVRFALVGTAVEEPTCPDCDVAFAITHTLVEGDPTACWDPDTPADGSVFTFGLSGDTIVFDYYDSGVWLPWYTAERVADHVDFVWSAELGLPTADDD